MAKLLPKFDNVFNSVFIKLFASVMLALILFACAMLILTHLVHDTSTNTRHQIIASQVAHQIEPLLLQLRSVENKQQSLEKRYLLALIRRSFSIYSESLNAKFGLYDADTREPIMLMNGLPPNLPPKPSWYFILFPHDDPKHPISVQTQTPSGYIIFYESKQTGKPPISPAINLITGTFLLLMIMAGVLWVIARTMTWRINQLSKQILQLGNGDFSARVTPVGNDEITILAKGFNQTAERIETLMNANKLLLAHASHEIRTPITRIRLQVEMMNMLANQLDDKGQEKFAKRADAINRDLTGLNDLVESILLVSRMDAGHAIEKVEIINLFELIKGEVQHYPHANFIGSQVEIEGQSNLLTHMIRNLLDNAHLHGIPPVDVQLYAIDTVGNKINLPTISSQTPEQPLDDNEENEPLTTNNENTDKNDKEKNEKQKAKKSSIFSRKKEDIPTPPSYERIRIAVIDNGEGIPLEKRTEIFSPFVRLQQEKKGSGLGLSLVSQIVTAHNGTIITDTWEGRTRFLITLPTKQH